MWKVPCISYTLHDKISEKPGTSSTAENRLDDHIWTVTEVVSFIMGNRCRKWRKQNLDLLINDMGKFPHFVLKYVWFSKIVDLKWSVSCPTIIKGNFKVKSNIFYCLLENILLFHYFKTNLSVECYKKLTSWGPAHIVGDSYNLSIYSIYDWELAVRKKISKSMIWTTYSFNKSMISVDIQ